MARTRGLGTGSASRRRALQLSGGRAADCRILRQGPRRKGKTVKILAVSNLYPPFWIGGYELICADVVAELLARGHDVLVATCPSHIPGPPDPPHVTRCLRLSAHTPNYSVSASDLWGEHACDTSDLDNVFALHRM